MACEYLGIKIHQPQLPHLFQTFQSLTPLVPVALAGGLGATALAAYLDARLHIRQDLRTGSRQVAMLQTMRHIAAKKAAGQVTMYDLFAERAGTAMGEHVFLVFEGRTWTYTQFFEALQPVGRWLLRELDVQAGEVVALDGGNSPGYLLLWFALEALGAVPAFINSKLTAQSLVHCVRICKARHLLADDDVVRPLVTPVEAELATAGCRTVYYSDAMLETLDDPDPKQPLPAERRRGLDPMGLGNLLFTSGTTGLPKAIVSPRARDLTLARNGHAWYLNLKPGDRMYTCLPLYHGAAHGLCIVPCLSTGATVVLSRKFSHATFWPEVHASRATHIQYVGELCRYLVNAPPGPLDKGHHVRVAWGNGMRPDVWEPFRERFGITCITELYAASDSQAFTVNVNRGPFSAHAIGVRGALWQLLNGRLERRVQVDPDTQEIRRGADGFAVPAPADGTPGETLLRLDPRNPELGHVHYLDNRPAVLARRVADVFRKGDLWFRCGDLMRQDAQGRLFFVDRLGDTFRWRAENVSTAEVADVVGACAAVAEANVYGVAVPHADGRAGCAAVVLRDENGGGGEKNDWPAALARHCLDRLPRYAVPLFVRLVPELEYTGTMKLQKGRLRAEGVDLDAIAAAARDKGVPPDPMYWLPPDTDCYRPFRQADWEELRGGRARL